MVLGWRSGRCTMIMPNGGMAIDASLICIADVVWHSSIHWARLFLLHLDGGSKVESIHDVSVVVWQIFLLYFEKYIGIFVLMLLDDLRNCEYYYLGCCC